MTMCYMHAVHQAIWRVTLMWILYLWLPQVLRRIQPPLAATQKIFGMWRRRKVDKTIINQTIADICKFVTDECCSVDTGSSLMTRASLQRSRSTRAYATGELTSTWTTTSYRVSFDFCELVLFVNYELCECNMNVYELLTCMHGSWILIWMDVIYVFTLLYACLLIWFCMCFKLKLEIK